MWVNQPFNTFLRVRNQTFSIKQGMTTSVKDAVRYPFGHIKKTVDFVNRPKGRNETFDPGTL
jgi:hypothetical protein